MQLTNSGRILFFVALFGIYFLSWEMQSTLLFCRDVSWGLHETQRLLDGGRYGKDFFDFSPPMILYLYSPVAVFSKLFSFSIFLVFRVYLFLIATFSLLICYSLIKKIFLPEENSLANLFLLAIAVIYVLLPLPRDFGQREHLLLIMIMPYLLLMAYRMQGGKIHSYAAIVIGVMAGLGFAMKPFFFIIFALVELFYAWNQRKLFAWVRIDVLVILMLNFLYGMYVVVSYPEYFSFIMPLSLRAYYQGYSVSLKSLLLQPACVFSFFAFLFYGLNKLQDHYKYLVTILLVATLGCLVSYFVQYTLWYYHLLPAYSLALLSLVLMFGFLVLHKNADNNYLLIVFGVVLTIFILVFARDIWTTLIFYPGVFFVFFSVLLFSLLYLLPGHKISWPIIIGVSLVILVGYIFSYQAQHTVWYAHRFSLTLLLLALSSTLLISRIKGFHIHSMYSMTLGVLIFSFPVYLMNGFYRYTIDYDKKMSPLISFMQTNAAQKPVYFFSTSLGYEFPAVDYANAIPASQYPLFVWLPGLIKQLNGHINSGLQTQLIKDKEYYIASVAQELKNNKPWYVFVDVQKNKPYLNGYIFDYLTTFSEYPEFKKVWASYRYVETIEQASHYKFQVYQLVQSS